MKRYQGKARTRILNDDEIRAVWAAADSHGQFGVADCNQDENCYYTINATKHAMSKKPSKGNIGWVEYLHVYADPNEDESPEQFKARSQTLIEGFELQPTFIVDSGNGIQLLWKVEPAIEVTGPEDFADVEAHNYALAEAFGADPSTRNIDRLFRLPGTTNFPNRKKRRLGRVECRARLLE